MPQTQNPRSQASSTEPDLFPGLQFSNHTNPWAVGTSTILNGGIVAIVLLLGFRSAIHPPARPVPHGDLSNLNLVVPLSARALGGGNGGGDNDVVDAIMGRTPPRSPNPVVAPQVPVLNDPKLAFNSAIAVPPEVKLPDNPNMPNIGVYRSTNVSLASNGPGSHGGMGSGPNGGYGPGSGPGFGPGTGEDIYTPGGNVSAPVPIVTPEAEFSEEARRQKYQGVCLVSVIIDAQGFPQSPQIIQRLGMGLDEKALEAVRRYRFKPALKNGRPVAARIQVAVDFRLY